MLSYLLMQQKDGLGFMRLFPQHVYGPYPPKLSAFAVQEQEQLRYLKGRIVIQYALHE